MKPGFRDFVLPETIVEDHFQGLNPFLRKKFKGLNCDSVQPRSLARFSFGHDSLKGRERSGRGRQVSRDTGQVSSLWDRAATTVKHLQIAFDLLKGTSEGGGEPFLPEAS